jgi:branched-chain amino acid transport system permease protein
MIAGLLVHGLVNSMVLGLIAVGFSLTFGISGVPNFAYGAFYLGSACLTWILLNQLGIPLALAIVITIAATGILGYLVYWAILLRMRGTMVSEAIATYALGIMVLEFFRWRGFVTYEFMLPPFVKGSVDIFGGSLSYQRIFIVGIALVFVLFIYLFTHHTRIGLSFRGIAQNERTAIALGIESDRTAALSLAMGSMFAAIAGAAIIPLGMISINMGYDALLIAIAVGIVGGMESTLGMFVAALILGYAQILTATFIAPEWMIAVYLIAIILVLAIKPSGLFGKFKELEERV